MKNIKKIILFLSLFCLTFCLTSCDNNKSYILFNKVPFTKDTMQMTTNIFAPGEKIYYLITHPHPMVTQKFSIQVLKMGANERLGYEMVWGKLVKARNEQIYYYTDYFVINQKGAYVMNVYSKDNPTKMISTNNFYVK